MASQEGHADLMSVLLKAGADVSLAKMVSWCACR
jgi:hypothetical protein